MKKKILKCCMVSALLLTSTVYAQQIQNIRGMVADTDGKPLSGVVVQVPGTKKQALTDVDGYFDLPITEGTKLRRHVTRKKDVSLSRWLHVRCPVRKIKR